ncbi:site-2 protease family protein [Streptomyces sp. NPDC096153]|uniref:site-2 protease family protein n=1 Tax=Streptomyces sp. NPDC096153 TaxID=3155548 RepID=UPI003320D616
MGRIAGVRVGVHWSVLLVFAVIALGLAQGRLPETHPGHPAVLYWLTGLSAAVVFFASLLAHEIAHAVVARRNGVEVEDIVLWLLGGAARLKTEASGPAAEVRIAGIGPLLSLALGGVFAAGAWLAARTSAPGLVVEGMTWLAGINLLLAVFNAVPAAPLDGGRLLRAFLWWRTGDRLRATKGAATAGRLFGWFLALLGLLLLMRTGSFGGLWLAVLGWFLIAAATLEGRQAELRATLTGVPVRDAMTADPVSVPAGLTVEGFLSDPRYRFRHSAFPVTGDGGAPVGLVTLEATRAVRREQQAVVTVGDVMLPLAEVTVALPDEGLAELLPRVQPGGAHRVLVLDGSRLVGILSASDISRTVTWLMNPGPGRSGRE